MPRLRSSTGSKKFQLKGSSSETEMCENQMSSDSFVIDRTYNRDKNVLDQLTSVDIQTNSQHSVNLSQSTVNLEEDKNLDEELSQSNDKTKISRPQEAIKDTKTADPTPKSRKKTNKKLGLSCSLQDGMKESLYICGNRKRKNDHLESDSSIQKLMKSSVLTSDIEKQHSLPPYEVSLHQTRKQRQKERSQMKGKSWFDMKAPELTEEKKNDLSVLQMRRVLDPKHFYKNPDIRALPKFFQMGKIVEDSSDFYSARIPKKQRKKTLVDELLEDTEFRRYNKRKYMEITHKAQSSHTRKGAAKHMKRLKKAKK